MSDWATEITKEFGLPRQFDADVAAALRRVRVDTLEEAAVIVETRNWSKRRSVADLIRNACKESSTDEKMTIEIKRGDAGLFYATSRDFKGLLVAEPTLEEVFQTLPQVMRDLITLGTLGETTEQIKAEKP